MPVPKLEWANPPRQRRSQRTQERILEATTALLAKRSFDKIAVAEIARRAGCSVGAFYGRFPDKQALLRTLFAEFCEHSRVTLDTLLRTERWEEVPLVDAVPALVRFVVEDYSARRGLRRAFLAAVLTDPELQEQVIALSRTTCTAIQALLELDPSETTHPDLEVAAGVLHRLLYATLDQTLLFPAGTPLTGQKLSDDDLIAELSRAILAYLGAIDP